MPSLNEYAAALYTDKDELLQQLPVEAEAAGLPAIHIPDEIGRLLQVLIHSAGVHDILELGTLFGYSTIWMGRALPPEGRIVSLEADPRHVEISRRNLQRAGLSQFVDVRQGPALQSLPALEGETFDLVFIDADKVNYPNYLDWSLRLTHPRSLILADNVWRQGAVMEGGDADEAGQAMAVFNRRVAEDARLLSTIIPTRDGRDAIMVAAVK